MHVVLDNVSTHRTPAIQRWLRSHPRFVFHFTPTYSSYLQRIPHSGHWPLALLARR